MTQPTQDTPLCAKTHLCPRVVAGCEGDSSVTYLMSEGTNPESAAELHHTCFFWSLADDAVANSASALPRLSIAFTARYPWLLLP